MVAGYKDGSSVNLSHILTRGFGIWPNDEIDSVSLTERIEITFDVESYVNSLEVRSLFAAGSVDSRTKHGVIDFYLEDSLFYTESLVGVQSSGVGALIVSYSTPALVDKLVYYVSPGQAYTSYSEFAVAKLNVAPAVVPAPGDVLLGSIGVGLVGWLRRRKAI